MKKIVVLFSSTVYCDMFLKRMFQLAESRLQCIYNAKTHSVRSRTDPEAEAVITTSSPNTKVCWKKCPLKLIGHAAPRAAIF